MNKQVDELKGALSPGADTPDDGGDHAPARVDGAVSAVEVGDGEKNGEPPAEEAEVNPVGDGVEAESGPSPSQDSDLPSLAACLGRDQLPPKPKKPRQILLKAVSGLLFVPSIIIGVFLLGVVLTASFSRAGSGSSAGLLLWLRSSPVFLFQLLAVGGVSLVAAVFMVYGNRARERQYGVRMAEWIRMAIVQLAVQNDGRLTVPQVVLALEINMDEVMGAMNKMVMLGMAQLEVGDDGGLYYRFLSPRSSSDCPVS